MKSIKKAKTIKEVFTEYNGINTTTTMSQLIPDNFKSLPYKDKIKIFNENRYKTEKRIILKCNENRIYFSIKRNALKRAGNKIFKKIDTDEYIIIKSTTITSCFLPDSQFIRYFFNTMSETTGNYQWLVKSNENFWSDYQNILKSKPIIKGILTGKIHSEETLIKSYMKVCSFPETINWKDFKTVYTGQNNFSYHDITLYDFKDFTVSPATTFRKIANEGATQTMLDCLKQASQTGVKINFNWSERRFNEEHDRMTEKLMLREISEKESKNIFDSTIDEPENGIQQLNTEKEVFKEGMMMHHCIYTNYWNKIKQRSYLAFHMLKEDGTEEENEGCTFAIGLNNFMQENSFNFQIYQKRNKAPTESQKQKMYKFAETHKEILLGQLKSNTKNSISRQIEEDIPF